MRPLCSDKRTVAVLLAGGVGSRMGSDVTKQSIMLAGKSVLRRAAEAFSASEAICGVVVVVRAQETAYAAEELRGIDKLLGIVVGGNCRAESAMSGFDFAEPYADYVAIHDVARPFVTAQQINKVVEAAYDCGAATAVSRMTDTVKEIGDDGYIIATHPRERLVRAQTPQVFSSRIYRDAISAFDGDLAEITDDNMLLERIGVRIRAVDVGEGNIKLTVPSDLRYAEFLLGEAISNE